MALSVPKTAVVDTGFWFALFNERDQHHQQALAKEAPLRSFRVVLPWPCLYETLNTKFVSNPLWVRQFESFVKRPNILFFDERKYRQAAYEQTLREAGTRAIGLVDRVIRSIIADRSTRVNLLLTFKQRDFADVCRANQIELW